MLDLPDIQGIVTSGYAHMPHSRYLFLTVTNQEQAKLWLKSVCPHITTSARRSPGEAKPHFAVNIGFTSLGLSAIGLVVDAVNTFPREFLQGIAHGERARVLGDTEDSAPDRWEFGGPDTDEIHVVLLLYATSAAHLETISTQVWDSSMPNNGLKKAYCQESFKKGVDEPFGFRDGISQPAIEGVPGKINPGQSVLKAGEFLLGYMNEYGVMPPMPTVAANIESTAALNISSANPTRREFACNGTYLVLRKLSQDVDGFHKFLDEQTRNPDNTSNQSRQTWLAAKMVGRWPSGAPLTLCAASDDPQLGVDENRNNSFNFADTDLEGFACPIGSHIRRANPRDSLPPNPKKSAMVSDRHRVIRRGRPYEAMESEKKEQGLIFIALNADLQRQFEFIQQTWINTPKFGGLYDTKDAISADNDGTGVMVIQQKPVRLKIHGIPRFVQVRGGGYFFLPGIRALRFLAES